MDRREIVRRLIHLLRWTTDGRSNPQLHAHLATVWWLLKLAKREQTRIEKQLVPLRKWRARGEDRVREIEEMMDG